MKTFKLFSTISIIALLSFFIYSCTKDVSPKEMSKEESMSKALDKAEQYLNSIANNPIVKTRGDSITGCFNGSVSNTPCNNPPQSKIDTIDMPGYGNCKAVVTWDQYWCPVNSGGSWLPTVVFDNFSAAPLDGSCDSVVLAWQNLVTSGNLSQFEADLTAFNLIAQNILKNEVMTQIATALSPFLNCGGNNVLLYSKFYTSTCAKTCYKLVIEKGVPKFYFVQRRCGISCCEELTAYCWNTITNSLQVSNTTKSAIGLCTGDFSTTCPNGYFQLSKFCEKPCF